MNHQRSRKAIIGYTLAIATCCFVFGLLLFQYKTQQHAFCSNKATTFGMYQGNDPSSFQPIDVLGVQGIAAWPVANPVFTPQNVPLFDGISNPHLTTHNGGKHLLLTFEATSCTERLHAIGFAESRDEGATWRFLNITAPTKDVSSRLRYPHALQHNNGGKYVVVSSATQTLLYSLQLQSSGPSSLPFEWAFNATLLDDEALLGASLWQDATTKSWMLLGSVPARGRMTAAGASRSEQHALAVYTAPSMRGPYTPHPKSPFRVEAGSPGGGISIPDREGGSVLRAGRTCQRSTCSDVQLFDLNSTSLIASLTAATSSKESPLKESPLKDSFSERIWKQSTAWDSRGRQSTSIVTLLNSGRMAALVAGDSIGYRRPSFAVFFEISLAIVRVLVLATSVSVVGHIVARYPPVRLSLLSNLHDCEGGYGETNGVGGGMLGKATRSGVNLHQLVGSAAIEDRPSPFATRLVNRNRGSTVPHSTASSPLPYVGAHNGTAIGSRKRKSVMHRWLSRVAQTRIRRTMCVVICAVMCIALAIALQKIGDIARPFWTPAYPLMVAGQYSKYSLMVMSYDKRKSLLNWYIKHYSQCPSVGEILIVWNKGDPPRPSIDYPGDTAVPVRLRVEKTNSMNNRYQPDSQLRYRGVLSLDDDILIPCNDIERAFSLWRENPHLLVGYYPRLTEEAVVASSAKDEIKRVWRYRGEPAAVRRGRYNLILSGAAFIDSRTAFPLYWSDALDQARALVDKVQNCDDLLMNFVVGNFTLSAPLAHHSTDDAGRHQLPPAIRYVRPARRIDVSWISGVGLSHAVQHFVDDAEVCLASFSEIFGRVPLRMEAFDWTGDSMPRCDAKTDVLQCSFLN